MSAQPAPDSLPVLTAGGHLRPADGACLMEYVSVLAGLPWSDRPRCTDPTLAAVARIVNDELTDAGRRDLGVRAVDLIGRTGPRGRLAPLIVEGCARVAFDHLPRRVPVLDRHRRRAARRIAADSEPGARRPLLPAALYARGPALHAITATALALRALPPARRDAALLAVLDAAISAATSAASATSAARATPAADQPGRYTMAEAVAPTRSPSRRRTG
ncbi:MAG TPA: hypothetical protein VGJ53_14165 [Micromonosporaceae bacterium]|jgi:hypothetical protein